MECIRNEVGGHTAAVVGHTGGRARRSKLRAYRLSRSSFGNYSFQPRSMLTSLGPSSNDLR